MQNVEQLLQDFGLSKSEAKIYLAGISYARPVGVQELQKRTTIKRPTIYHNIHLLESRGLVAKAVSYSRTLYTFQSPDQLEHVVQADIRAAKQKLRTVAQLSLELKSVGVSESTTVRHFEGIEGIKAVVETALYCKKPEWRIIAPVQNFFSESDEAYAKYYVVTRKRHNIISKTLWEHPKEDGRELSKDELAERNPRYLPESMHGKFKATTIIFDNKVAIITSMNEQSAVLIESTEVHDTFASMFDALYESSKSISFQANQS